MLFSLHAMFITFYAVMFLLYEVVISLYGKLRIGSCLKGLGHAILGNFSTDQMVIELTKISK